MKQAHRSSCRCRLGVSGRSAWIVNRSAAFGDEMSRAITAGTRRSDGRTTLADAWGSPQRHGSSPTPTGTRAAAKGALSLSWPCRISISVSRSDQNRGWQSTQHHFHSQSNLLTAPHPERSRRRNPPLVSRLVTIRQIHNDNLFMHTPVREAPIWPA